MTDVASLDLKILSSESDFETGYQHLDIDSVVVVGCPSMRWLAPQLDFECHLKIPYARLWDDKKVIRALCKRLVIPVPAGYRFVYFKVGGCRKDSIYIYALVKVHNLEGPLKTYRKMFFERYLFEAFKRVRERNKGDAEATRGPMHTVNANSILEIPSETSLFLYPGSWGAITRELDLLLRSSMPPHTIRIFAGLTIHGIKSDTGGSTMTSAVILRLSNLIDPTRSDLVLFNQIHVAVTVGIKDQLVTMDHERLRTYLPAKGRRLYGFFGLENLGNFTYDALGSAGLVKYPDVSYLQFYLEDFHLLKKGLSGRKCSLFVDAVLGYPSLGRLPDMYRISNKEIVTHADNVPKRLDQLKVYLESIEKGPTGRFEACFDSKGLHSFLLPRDGRSDEVRGRTNCSSSLLTRFIGLFDEFVGSGLVVASSGDWWKQRIVQPFRKHVFTPYCDYWLTARNTQHDTKIHSAYEIRELYDLEQIIYRWCCGTFNKDLDLKRISHLKTLSPKSNLIMMRRQVGGAGGAEASNPSTRYTDIVTLRPESHAPPMMNLASESKLNLVGPWLDLASINRKGYTAVTRNHVGFLASLAPLRGPLLITARGHYGERTKPQKLVEIFNLLFRFYDAYCKKSWNVSLMSGFTESQAAAAAAAARQSGSLTKRIKKHGKTIRVSRLPVTPLGIFLSIMRPSTMLGRIVLLICARDEATVGSIIKDGPARREILEIVEKNVALFPSYLLNVDIPANSYLTRRWSTWLPVSSQRPEANVYDKASIDLATTAESRRPVCRSRKIKTLR